MSGLPSSMYRVIALVGLLLGATASAQQSRPAPEPGNDNEASILGAIQQVCPQLATYPGRADDPGSDLNQLFYRCNRLLNADSIDSGDPLQALTGEEVTAAQSTAIDFSTGQIGVIAARLAGLRAVARGDAFAALEPAGTWTLLGGGAASGDELAAEGRLGLFVNARFGRGEQDKSLLEAGFDVDTYGGTIGLDYRFTDNFVAGATVGYGATEADFDHGGTFDSDGVSGNIFASWYGASWYLDAVVGYGSQDHESERRIQYQVTADNPPPGAPIVDTIDEIVAGDTDGEITSAGLSFGYDFGSGPLRIGPILAVSYLEIDVDGLSETGSTTGLNLQYADQTAKSLQLQAGIDVGYAISTSWGVLLPQARVVYVSEEENDQQVYLVRYAADPCSAAPGVPSGDPGCSNPATSPSATSFTITSEPPDDSFVRWGLSLSSVFANGVATYIDYDAIASYENVDYSELTIGVRYAFR